MANVEQFRKALKESRWMLREAEEEAEEIFARNGGNWEDPAFIAAGLEIERWQLSVGNLERGLARHQERLLARQIAAAAKAQTRELARRRPKPRRGIGSY